MVKLRLAFAPLESTAWTVNVESPAAFGVPEIAPVLERVRFAGSAPELTDQVTLPVAPLAARGAEYATPMLPSGRLVVVIWSVVFTWSVKVALAESPAESFTVTLNGNEPPAGGVPESAPLELRLSHDGRPEDDQTYPPVPPEAPSVCE